MFQILSGLRWFIWQLPFALCPADDAMFGYFMWTIHVYTPIVIVVLDHETMKPIVAFRGYLPSGNQTWQWKIPKLNGGF